MENKRDGLRKKERKNRNFWYIPSVSKQNCDKMSIPFSQHLKRYSGLQDMALKHFVV